MTLTCWNRGHCKAAIGILLAHLYLERCELEERLEAFEQMLAIEIHAVRVLYAYITTKHHLRQGHMNTCYTMHLNLC